VAVDRENQSPGVLGWFNSHPTIALMFAVFLAVAVGAVALRKQTAPTATATDNTAQGDLSGLDTDVNGNKIVYRNTADYFNISSIIEDSYNQETNNHLPGQPELATAFVRSRYNSGTTSGYDKAHPHGVPIRSSPGGTVVREQAYGSTVQVKHATSAGPSNFGGSNKDGGGSTAWLELANGGFISAYDLTGYI
jgi:hypothetical protein